MTKWLRVLAVVMAAAASACGASADGPPQIVVDRTACAHCGMLVSEPAFAAASRAPGSDARVFDDIRCLLDSLEKAPGNGQPQLWFHDAADGQWIDAARATFVAAPALRTPMGGGIAAYRERAAAEAAALRYGGRVVDGLPQLLAQRGDGR